MFISAYGGRQDVSTYTYYSILNVALDLSQDTKTNKLGQIRYDGIRNDVLNFYIVFREVSNTSLTMQIHFDENYHEGNIVNFIYMLT